MKVAASPRIYMGDARRFAMAGFPRIVSLPLEGKVPRRGGKGTGGMKASGGMRLKYVVYESTLSTAPRSPFPMRGRLRRSDAPRRFL